MKAMVFHGPRDIRYEEFPEPKRTGKRDLVVRVAACSICGSDLHAYRGRKLGPIDYATTTMRFCVGHEAIGEVVEIGPEVRKHRVGDRILLAGGVGCGRCEPCGRGAFNLCEASAVLPYGFSPLLQGLQAEFALVKQADVSAIRIPDGVTDDQALLLTDALATGFVGAKRAAVGPGSVVAVIGHGPIGKCATEAAFALGAEKVFVVEPSAFRRELASAAGATTFAPDEAVSRILDATRGRGVDACIEAVGREETLAQAIRITRPGGQIAVLGLLDKESRAALMPAQLKSLSLFVGVAGVADSWPELVPLVASGRLRAGGMFTHRFDLRDGAEAFRLFDAGQDTVMKVRIDLESPR